MIKQEKLFDNKFYIYFRFIIIKTNIYINVTDSLPKLKPNGRLEMVGLNEESPLSARMYVENIVTTVSTNLDASLKAIKLMLKKDKPKSMHSTETLVMAKDAMIRVSGFMAF